jgi:hypothetical protein
VRILMMSEPGLDGVFFMVRAWILWLRKNRPEWTVDWAYSTRRTSAEHQKFLVEWPKDGGALLDLGVTSRPEGADLKALWDLYRMIRRNRPDLIHAHSSKAGALARLLAGLPGVPPILYSPHAYYGMGGGGGWKNVIFQGIERALASRCLTVNCSEDEADFAHETLKIPKARLRIVHHGLEEEAFVWPSPEQRKAAREFLGIPLDLPLLLTIGRDAGQKRYDALYNVIARQPEDSNWGLVHAGWGSVGLRKRLPQAWQARVWAMDHVPKESVYRLYHAVDGMVMTSRYEGLSLAVLDGLVQGLPMILTYVPGFKVFRTLGFDRIQWVEGADAEVEASLALALKEWAGGGKERHADQSEKARGFFTGDRQFERLAKICEEALGPRRHLNVRSDI